MNVQPALTEFVDNWRCELPATPYQRGFDDCRYSHVYANPYDVGTLAWQQYCNGNQDARTAQHAERTQH